MPRETAFTKLISLMKEHPEDFNIDTDGFYLAHKPTGVQVWIANGFFFYGFYRPKGYFTLLEKAIFSYYIRKINRHNDHILSMFLNV